MVAPEPDFTYRPPSTAAPFALGYVERYALSRLADDLGARLVPDALARVSAERHEIVTTSGAVVPYDRLVLAVGARPYPAFQHAITLGGEDTHRSADDAGLRSRAGRCAPGGVRGSERRVVDAAAL